MAWCLFIFVTAMGVPGFTRFIDFNAHPITHNFPLEQSLQLPGISPSYIPAYSQQVTHVYTPPENTYRGFTYQTLDIYGGISQVGFMTGSEANSLLQDSFKALGTVDISVPKLILNKTPDTESTSDAKTHSLLPEQSLVIPPKTEENPLSQSGYYFPPIQVNHFQAGASYISPPFFNAQPNFLRQLGVVVTENPDNSKITEADTTNNDSSNINEIIPTNNDSNNTNLSETKAELNESDEQLRSIKIVESENSSTSPSSDVPTLSNENLIVTTETDSGLQSSTSRDDMATTTKDEDSTDIPDSSKDTENNSNPNSAVGEDESTGSNINETTLSDNSTEENSTTETSG